MSGDVFPFATRPPSSFAHFSYLAGKHQGYGMVFGKFASACRGAWQQVWPWLVSLGVTILFT